MSCVLTIPQSVPIYFAVEPVDMRRGHDGLAAIVRAHWDVDVFSGNLFVFLGRRLDRCKILYWDRGGFVLYYKRLERGRFRAPALRADGRAVQIDSTLLAMMLDGIDVARVVRPRRWEPPVKMGIDKSIGI